MVTGPRPLGLGVGGHPECWRPLWRPAYRRLCELEPEVVYVGGAPGWDLIVENAALKARQQGHVGRVVLVEPWLGFELWLGLHRDYKKEGASGRTVITDWRAHEAMVAEYQRLRAHVDHVVTVNYFEDDRQPNTSAQSTPALMLRNDRLVNCLKTVDVDRKVVLTCTQEPASGGTKATLDRARRQVPTAEVMNLWPG